MSECHSTTTPVDTKAKLSATDGAPVVDPSEYRSLAGALQYLTLTRSDLAYDVQQVCLFMHDPREPHLALVKVYPTVCEAPEVTVAASNTQPQHVQQPCTQPQH